MEKWTICHVNHDITRKR